MNNNYQSEQIINNEFDYSNIVATADNIAYIVNYCDQMNKQLTELINKDEEKNKQFKPEYKEYMYKKSFSQRFEVYIREKSYNNITCKDYESFLSAVKDGNLTNVLGLDIKLNLDYSRGKGNDLKAYENSFTIIFKPYEITFARKSNNNDSTMNQIEEQINNMLKRFPIANSIFCNKSN